MIRQKFLEFLTWIKDHFCLLVALIIEIGDCKRRENKESTDDLKGGNPNE